jgi:hypothetical protein
MPNPVGDALKATMRAHDTDIDAVHLRLDAEAPRSRRRHRAILAAVAAVVLTLIAVPTYLATTHHDRTHADSTSVNSTEQELHFGRLTVTVPRSWTPAELAGCEAPSHNAGIIYVTRNQRPMGTSNLCLYQLAEPNLIFLSTKADAPSAGLATAGATQPAEFDRQPAHTTSVDSGTLIVFDNTDLVIQVQSTAPGVVAAILKSIRID